MSQTTSRVGDKEVLLSQPYRVPAIAELVAREEELKLITAAWISGADSYALAPLLLGEPGVGKNRIVYELAQRTGKELYIFQGHDDVTSEDLACAVRFSDDPDKKMDYVLSPLVTAMHLGGICFIDEIAKIRPRALALLVSVLDERRYIDSTLLGERVYAQPGFRFVAATNTADLEGNALPEFIRSRMRPVIQIGYPPREEIDEIVRTRFPRIREQVAPLLDCLWALWLDQDGDRRPTPRDAIYLFDLALSLADYDALAAGRPETFPVEGGGAAPEVTEQHLRDAFQELFGQGRWSRP